METRASSEHNHRGYPREIHTSSEQNHRGYPVETQASSEQNHGGSSMEILASSEAITILRAASLKKNKSNKGIVCVHDRVRVDFWTCSHRGILRT